MVFQNYALYPHLSVFENIAFGLRLRKESKDEINERVTWAAEMLDLTPYLDRKPKQLSGGQRQRVAMGRAIVRKPQVFLMDEPLSNLDAKLRVQMRADIAKLQHDLETTTIYVTHDQVEAMTMGDRVAVMQGGVLQQVAEPQRLYDRPENLFVAGFIGTPPMNLLEARVSVNGGVSIELGGTTLDVPDQALQGVSEGAQLRRAHGRSPGCAASSSIPRASGRTCRRSTPASISSRRSAPSRSPTSGSRRGRSATSRSARRSRRASPRARSARGRTSSRSSPRTSCSSSSRRFPSPSTSAGCTSSTRSRVSRSASATAAFAVAVLAAVLATAGSAGTRAAGPPSGAALAALAQPGADSSLATDRIYFVMTDRYANGDPSNDTGGLSGGRSTTGFDPTSTAFWHGGDFKGLTGGCTDPVHGLQRIKNLGFNAIWVTPAVVNQILAGRLAPATTATGGSTSRGSTRTSAPTRTSPTSSTARTASG